MTSPKFSLSQQVFTLSLLSNVGDNTPAGEDRLTDVRTTLNQKLKAASAANLLFPWQIGWGPVLYEPVPAVLSSIGNAMYVAVSGNIYVVAIAATNRHSVFDLFNEDAEVGQTLPLWTGGSSVQVSKGTADGLKALLEMRDPAQPAASQTLSGFLANLPSPETTTVIFTGHSLGGALAPTLALYLMAPQGGQAPSQRTWQASYVYPTAGPSAMNGYFADLFNSTFPQISGQPFNQLVWNNLDIVPHAWVPTMVSEIAGLYTELGISMSPDQQSVLTNLIQRASQVNTQPDVKLHYTQIQNQELNGTFNKDCTSFLDEAWYQHLQAYITQLGVTDLETQGILQIKPLQAAGKAPVAAGPQVRPVIAD